MLVSVLKKILIRIQNTIKKIFDWFLIAIGVIAFCVAVWFFFVFFAIVFGIAFLAFVFGVIPVDVTYRDGTKKKYRIGDVIKLWRSK